ncbi:MAG: SGNH/GDSL hydrolase family protein [Bacteroidota bacterium]
MRRVGFLMIFLLTSLFSARAVNVTFTVDFSNGPAISPNGVHFYGSPTSWNILAMNPIGAQRFSVTLPLNAGDAHEFQYLNGDSLADAEAVFGTCAFTANRHFVVPPTDTVLPVVCFGHCDSLCTPPSGMRLAAIGNSITWGWNATTPFVDHYPAQLQDSLGATWRVVNFGAPGAAVIRQANWVYTDQLVYAHAQQFGPEVAVVMLGTNDSRAATWDSHSADFRMDYDSLLQGLMATNPRLILVLPPAAFANSFGVRDSVIREGVVPEILAVARRRGVQVLDVYERTQGQPSWFSDGLHPNATGTAAIARWIYESLQIPPFWIQQNGNVLNAPNGFDYQWYRDDEAIVGATGPSVTATVAGVYRVAMRPHHVFRDWWLSDTIAVVPVGMEAADLGMDVEVWPQPGEDGIWVRRVGAAKGRIEVWTPDGRLKAVLPAGREVLLDVQHWPRGSYFLSVQTENGMHHKLILLQ